MSPQVAELLKSALALPPAEREQLADGLWASFDPPGDYGGLTEDEFAAELDRRAAELKAEPGHGIPWEEVQKMR